MAVILKQKHTSQIYTCTLVNHYRLEYYGTKYWDDMSLAQEQYVEFLERMGDEPADWEPVEIEENKMKIFNVKLKNDPKLDLFVDKQWVPSIVRNDE